MEGFQPSLGIQARYKNEGPARPWIEFATKQSRREHPGVRFESQAGLRLHAVFVPSLTGLN
jgi:hypothetical protein